MPVKKPDGMFAVDVASDRFGEHTTIAIRLPGCVDANAAHALRQKVEYELHKISRDMAGAIMGRSDSAIEAMHRQQQMQAQNMMMQQAMLSPYSPGVMGGVGLQQAMNNQAVQTQAAMGQSAPPKAVKKKARKKLLLCEVNNAV